MADDVQNGTLPMPETTGQRTDAAERSAHVLRAGHAQQPAREIFAGPEFGPMRLRVVADLEAENARLREALGSLAAMHVWVPVEGGARTVASIARAALTLTLASPPTR